MLLLLAGCSEPEQDTRRTVRVQSDYVVWDPYKERSEPGDPEFWPQSLVTEERFASQSILMSGRWRVDWVDSETGEAEPGGWVDIGFRGVFHPSQSLVWLDEDEQVLDATSSVYLAEYHVLGERVFVLFDPGLNYRFLRVIDGDASRLEEMVPVCAGAGTQLQPTPNGRAWDSRIIPPLCRINNARGVLSVIRSTLAASSEIRDRQIWTYQPDEFPG